MVTILACWVTSKLSIDILAGNGTVDWCIEMLAFVGVADTRWESLSTSWESWTVFTSGEVTDKEISGLGSVASVAGKSTDLDSVVDLAVDVSVDWHKCVTFSRVGWDKDTLVTGFLVDDGDRVFLWHKCAGAIDSILVAGLVLGDEYFAGGDFDVGVIVVLKFGDNLQVTVRLDSLNESSHLLLVHESYDNFVASTAASPVWLDGADSSPGIGGFTEALNLMAVSVGAVVFRVSVEATAHTGSCKAKLGTDEE